MDEQSIDDDFNIELGMSQMAKNNFINAQALDADYYAEMSALAKSTGRPVESVMQDAKPAKTELATGLIDFENIVNTNPATSMLMADPHKAKVVGADMPATAKLESAWIGVRDSVDENLFRPLMRGSKNAYANLLLTNKENWLVGWEQNPNIPEWKKAIKRRSFAKEQGQINREIDALPQSADVERGLQEINDATDWQDAAKAIINNPKAVWNTSVESLATSAPTLGLALATGGISRGATAAASGVGSYETEYSSTIKEVLTANGVDFKDDQAVKVAFADPLMMMEAKQKALLRGIPIGVFDAASTYFAGVPLSGAVGTLTSKLSRTFAEFAGQAAFGAAGEKTAQVVTGEDNKGSVLLEAAAEVPSAVFEAKANYKHAGVIAADARIKAEQVDRALKNKEQYDKLAEMSAADKVIKRAPELVAEIVAQATEDTEASHIYVSANDLNQSGLAADVAANSPTVAAEIAQATQNGGMIAIPAAEYATTIANQPWAQDFNSHIRETPDATSAAEAQKIIDTNGAELKADFDLAMQSLDADEVFETSVGTVKDSILADLNGIQAHSASVNEGVATAFAAYYATRAKQLGVTPEALYALRPLSWRSEAGQGDLQQGGAQQSLQDISSKWSDKGLSVAVRQSPNGLVTLDKVIVPTEQRGAGVGSEFMQELLAYADQQGVQVALTPSKDFGGSVPRLKEFYKTMGFVENKGKNKNLEISEQFYRDPVARVPQTETAAFKAWFKDSKVVDADGKQLVVYHGAATGFSTFDERKIGDRDPGFFGAGFYFTPNEGEAQDYADSAADADGADGGEVIPAFLAIQKPFVWDMEEGDGAKATRHALAAMGIARSSVRGNSAALSNLDERRKFAAAMKAAGHDGVIVRDEDGIREVVAFRPNQIKSAIGNSGDFSSTNPNILKQGATAPRGSFNPDTFTIALLKGADLSTALHEGAHFFFENDLALASQIVAGDSISEGEKQLLADVSTLLTWHGITGDIKEQLNTWYSLDREVTREYHEQTAESFERYLLEGKSPSPEMQVYFQKFRAWMLSVYKSVKEQLARNPRGGALNDDVRGVFDRMLATNEQIAQAQQARGMMDMFTTAEAGGMTAEEFAQYQALGREPTNEAIEQMQAKGLKDMAWLHRTKSKAIKRLAKDAAQLRADYRNEAAREVMAQPVYQAWQFLTRKISEADKLPDEPSFAKSKSLDPASDSFIDAIAKLGGLNEDDVKALYGVTRKGYPMKDPVFGKPVLRRKNGLTVEEMALALADNGYLPLDENGKFDTNDFEERFMGELGGSPQYSIYYNYGADEFRSGDQVANPMALGAGRINTAELRAMNGISAEDVEALTSRKMTVQKGGLHPDIVAEVVGGFDSGDAMVQAILDAQDPHAMIEELVDERMMQEHGELSTPAAIAQAADAAVFNEARLKFATTEANALAKATGQRSVLLAAAKQFAKERLARTTIRNIKPAQFAAASAKAGKAAESARKAGDIALASAQKRNEVMHTATAKAAYDALTEVDKAVAYFKRVQKSNTLAKDAQAQIADILTKYDLRVSQSGQAIDRAESMRAYVMRQLADGNLPEFSPDMLSPSDKAVYIAATASIDEQGNYVYADEAERAKLLADMLDASAQMHYKNMSLEQLRALRENIEQLEHLGKLKNRLLMAKDNRTLDEIKTAIADSIVANASDSGMILPTRDDLPTRVKNAIKHFATSHIRMAVRAFVIDGGKNNGPFWEHFILPANEASNKETALTAEITSKLSAILDPVLKELRLSEQLGVESLAADIKAADGAAGVLSAIGNAGKGKFYPELGISLNWSRKFSILLNMGNESNTQRLLSGGVGGKQGITLGQLMPVMSEFSSAEIKAAQQVWDLFESLRPALAELEQATKGKEPEWIPARALNVTSKDGEVITLRGGYYPVVYDQQMSMRLDQEDPTVNVADLVKSVAKATAVTRQSFTKARVEEVHGRPLLLTMDGLYRGLNDVIHDLSFRTYAINSSRLLSSHRIKTALAEHYGMDLVRDMSQFVLELVVSSSRTDAADRAAAFARKNVAMTGLGLNIMNWLQQPFGVSNSIVRLGGGKEGAKWVLRGMQHYFANPMAATADARAKSMFMADRGRTRFRELNEIRNKVQVEGLSQRIAPYLMGGMIFMQQIADSITWHGAVAKAIADDPTLPDSRLYDIADQVVRDSQGGGQDVDLSEMEKGGSVKKLFTVFFNFMNTGNNLAYMSQNTGRDKGTKFADLLLVYAFPVLLSAVMKSALVPSDGDEDWEDMDWADIAKSFAAAQASYLISGMFLVREAQMVVKEVFGEGMGFGYSGPTGLRVIPDAYKFAQQAKQGEIDDAFRKAAINLTGDLTGLPSAQTNRTITGTKALVEGETNNPAAVVFGFSKQR